VRSDIAEVRAESAPTITVRMHCGGGHRGNYGAARGGFGAGRQGRGRGRTPARNPTWICTNKEVADQEEAAAEDGQDQAPVMKSGRGRRSNKTIGRSSGATRMLTKLMKIIPR